ncbi:MAG: hypothetical protein ACRBCK_03775 [Alphaproteobacteria bacterium]
MADLLGGGESSISGAQSGASVSKDANVNATSSRQASQTRKGSQSKPGEEDSAGNAATAAGKRLDRDRIATQRVSLGEDFSFIMTGSATMLALSFNVAHINGGHNFEMPELAC